MLTRLINSVKKILKLIIFIFLTVIIYFLFNITYLACEQNSWGPNDPIKISLKDCKWSKRGVVLYIYAPSGIDLILKQRSPAFVFPFFPAHYPPPYYYFQQEDGTHVVVIDMFENDDYQPFTEHIFAIKSKDGYWYSGGLYTTLEPEISIDEYNQIKNKGIYKKQRFKFM